MTFLWEISRFAWRHWRICLQISFRVNCNQARIRLWYLQGKSRGQHRRIILLSDFYIIFTNSLVSEEAKFDAVGNEVLDRFVCWSQSHETVKRDICIVSEETKSLGWMGGGACQDQINCLFRMEQLIGRNRVCEIVLNVFYVYVIALCSISWNSVRSTCGVDT
jgi:hypothetical protein